MKIQVRHMPCQEIIVNGLIKLTRIRDGKWLLIGDVGMASMFHVVLGLEETEDTYLVNGTPELIEEIKSHDEDT